MEIIIILGLIILNGLFSMSEIALISARKARLESDAKRGSKSARSALNLAAEPNKFLSTVQIGITLIGILTGLYSGDVFAADLAQVIEKSDFMAPFSMTIAKTIIVIIVTYLTLVIGELVPKRIGMNSAEKISKAVAKPMTILSKIVSPFVWLLSVSTTFVFRIMGMKIDNENKVTEEEIKAIVKEGYDGGEVHEVEQDIVERVFTLGDRDVESIMTHRSEMRCLDIADTIDVIRQKITANMHNVYPVTSGKPDNVIGVVHLKDLFLKVNEADFSIDEIMQPAQFLPENKSVYNALTQFKEQQVPYGIVIDEFGGLQGIVTLVDIMEALVGQVHEQGDDQELTQRSDGTWLVDGQYSFYNFLDHFDLTDMYAEHDYNTVSGLILEILEHLPKTGETLTWLNIFEFEVIDMDGVRIDKVLVTRIDKHSHKNELPG